MKILAIGDFHGKFPEKLKKIAKQKDINLILSTGDYTGIADWRPALKKMFIEASKGKRISVEEILGKKKYKKLLKKDYAAGKIPLKELNKFHKKVFSVFGNGDWYKWEFSKSNRDYTCLIKKLKNFKNINRGKAKFRGIKIVGFGGYLDPDIYFTNKGIKAINTSKERTMLRKQRYVKWEKQLMKLMKYKPDILLAHYNPYKCCDKMNARWSALHNQHMGISSFNRALKKFKPVLMVCGHIHEGFGSCKIGKTIVVNAGSAGDGQAAIIDFDEKNKRIKTIKFIR